MSKSKRTTIKLHNHIHHLPAHLPREEFPKMKLEKTKTESPPFLKYHDMHLPVEKFGNPGGHGQRQFAEANVPNQPVPTESNLVRMHKNLAGN